MKRHLWSIGLIGLGLGALMAPFWLAGVSLGLTFQVLGSPDGVDADGFSDAISNALVVPALGLVGVPVGVALVVAGIVLIFVPRRVGPPALPKEPPAEA